MQDKYNMKHDVWMLGWLLFKICNQNKDPFLWDEYWNACESKSEDKQERYKKLRRELEELPGPEVLPEARDIYLQMLVFDPLQRPSIQ